MTDSRNAFSLDAYLADLAPLINLECGPCLEITNAPGRITTM